MNTAAQVTVNREVSGWNLQGDGTREDTPISSLIEVKIGLITFRGVTAEENFFWFVKDVAPDFHGYAIAITDDIWLNMEMLWDSAPDSLDDGHQVVNLVGLHQLIKFKIDAEMSALEAELKTQTMCDPNDSDNFDFWPTPPIYVGRFTYWTGYAVKSINDIMEMYQILLNVVVENPEPIDMSKIVNEKFSVSSNDRELTVCP